MYKKKETNKIQLQIRFKDYYTLFIFNNKSNYSN